jgi:hypothetical protein
MSEATAEPLTPPIEPVHAEVRAMHDALDRGDHHLARTMATTLATSEEVPLRAAGEAMLARFRRDPWIDVVFVGTALLMLFLAVHYLGHRG